MPDVSSFCPACGQAVALELDTIDSRQKLLAVLAYVGLIPAIILLVIPALRGDRFVRFNAWQSILFSVSSALLGLALRLLFVVFSILPLVGFLLAWLSLIFPTDRPKFHPTWPTAPLDADCSAGSPASSRF